MPPTFSSATRRSVWIPAEPDRSVDTLFSNDRQTGYDAELTDEEQVGSRSNHHSRVGEVRSEILRVGPADILSHDGRDRRRHLERCFAVREIDAASVDEQLGRSYILASSVAYPGFSTMELTLKQRQDVEGNATHDILERLGVGCPRGRCRSRSEREEID